MSAPASAASAASDAPVASATNPSASTNASASNAPVASATNPSASTNASDSLDWADVVDELEDSLADECKESVPIMTYSPCNQGSQLLLLWQIPSLMSARRVCQL